MDQNERTGPGAGEELFRVGVITRAHGIKGEVMVFPVTDEPKMFREWKTLIVSGKNGQREAAVQSVSFFRQMVILKLEGIDDRDAAEMAKRSELFIRRSQASPCRENEHFITDLIGLEAADEDGNVLGVCSDILKTAANDVFVISREGHKDLLVPAIRDCILNVDLEKRRIVIHLLPGLLELYD
ncbi:MAG: ribosome maturation factor RimM [Lachnospiraceae bacterium]|jgi:16S rRNA processing protein RimM